MSSSSNDSKSPPDDGLGWLNSAMAEDAPTNKIDAPIPTRTPGAKKSLAPPPAAGRVPLNSTTAGLGPRYEAPRHDAPRPDAVSVPDLPAGMQTQDDPLADLFDGSAQPVVIDAPPTSGADAVRADATPTRPAVSTSVAKVDLARAQVGGPAQEIMSIESKRDPRADPEMFPPRDAAHGQPVLQDLVLDPDLSVARNLGRASLDTATEGVLDVTETPAPEPVGLSDLPEFSDALDAESLQAVRPTRSMRSAMMIIGLVLISGAAATALSLGIIGGPPSRLRTPPTADAVPTPAKISAPVTAPVAPPPAVAAAPVEKPPAPIASVEAAPVVTAEPAPVAAVEPAVVEPSAEVPAPVVAAVSGDPIAAGDALLRGGDADGAAIQFRAALAADAEDHHAMEGMARVHLARGEPQLAIPFAEAIVKRRPKRDSYRALLDEAKRAAHR